MKYTAFPSRSILLSSSFAPSQKSGSEFKSGSQRIHPPFATATIFDYPPMAKDDLFSSLISDVKTYTGHDPLLPWLRGIRKMKDSLPSTVLKEKLPRFLQKCAQTFKSDRRYGNDIRYLRVWLQLMDFVDDPRALLRTMEENHIGNKQSIFYQAYALYYEKMKRYDKAEHMYHLGVKNLAEPIDELQKSYDQFLHRMERNKNKRTQRHESRTTRRPLSAREIQPNCGKTDPQRVMEMGRRSQLLDGYAETKNMGKDNSSYGEDMVQLNHAGLSADLPDVTMGRDSSENKEYSVEFGLESISKQQVVTKNGSGESKKFSGDDTVVVKFIGSAMDEKSNAENACHHGLVDPTINMMEAIDTINSMFREPLETVPMGQKSCRYKLKKGPGSTTVTEVFIDENAKDGFKLSDQGNRKSFSCPQHSETQGSQFHQEQLEIYVDDNGNSEDGDLTDGKENFQRGDDLAETSSCLNAFVFPCPKDQPSESLSDRNVESSSQPKFREDTVVCKFVGSAILDEPEVENVCHHGLVDPTINMKEAMDDINNMFGKPMDFVRSKRPWKWEKATQNKSKSDVAGFLILADDDVDHEQALPPAKLPNILRESDLCEPTLVTKEAMDDINTMFNMPLDF